MSLSTCLHCGGHIPLGPTATNRCEKCGKHVMGEPNSGGGASYHHKMQAAASLNLAMHHRSKGEHELERSYARQQKYHINVSKAFVELEAEEALCWELLTNHPGTRT